MDELQREYTSLAARNARITPVEAWLPNNDVAILTANILAHSAPLKLESDAILSTLEVASKSYEITRHRVRSSSGSTRENIDIFKIRQRAIQLYLGRKFRRIGNSMKFRKF